MVNDAGDHHVASLDVAVQQGMVMQGCNAGQGLQSGSGTEATHVVRWGLIEQAGYAAPK
jgi:hypothetical protein